MIIFFSGFLPVLALRVVVLRVPARVPLREIRAVVAAVGPPAFAAIRAGALKGFAVGALPLPGWALKTPLPGWALKTYIRHILRLFSLKKCFLSGHFFTELSLQLV